MLHAALLVACAQAAVPSPADIEKPVVDWLRAAAVALADGQPIPAALDGVFASARVIGLGEATHGQHESFELKRQLTLHLVRKHGYAIVAYEASSASTRACDDYIAGRTSDARAALGGFGMMIWSIQENAALLEDLRAWNAQAPAGDRVRFVGIDVQDATAAASRLHALLVRAAPDLAERAGPLGRRIEEARQALFAGQPQAFDALMVEVESLKSDLASVHPRLVELTSRADADEALLRSRELGRCMIAARTPAGRDRAMGETLLEELERAGESARAVLWTHNAHATKGPLRYMDSTDPGTGGVLRDALGERYYAVGFAFGTGSFGALARDPKLGLGFQSYAVSAVLPHSLEAPFAAAGLERAFVDLRSAPRDGDVARWLDAPHGQRWFGGYGVPESFDAARDGSELPVTIPRVDFDGIVYLARTTPSRPADPARVLPAAKRASDER